MPNEQVDWIRLEDVLAAADRCLAPIGPELAGFIVFETAQRLREIGGVVDASELAIGTSGHVALTAAPARGSEQVAALRLRELLGRLLAVSTSSTPALRQCSKRRDPRANTLGLLCRELEAALIPLNRAASRRGLARVARATVDAIDSGRLDTASPNDGIDSEPPPVEVAARPRSSPPPLPPRAPTPIPPVVEDEPIAIAVEHMPTPTPIEIEEKTPFCAPVFDDDVHPMAGFDHESSGNESPGGFVVVSHLPPLVSERPPTVAVATPHPTFTFTVEPPAPPPRKDDRVAKLIEAFEVSRRRDDPALARDLKAMVGIETHAPPPVTVHVKVRQRRNDDIQIDHELPREPSVLIEDEAPPPLPKKRGGMFAVAAVAAVACGLAAVAARPSALDTLLGPPLPPPGDVPVAAAAPTQIPTPRMPIVCEASMTLENVPPGAEVLRRIGATPLSVVMPMHVPFDLVATMDGHVARRAHVDASAIWQKDATGGRLDVPFALDATSTEMKWPAATGVVPLRVPRDAARGMLRATSTPNGASVWLVVDATAITAVPCGNGVDLMVVPNNAPQKTVHVDWAAFAGSPPRAVARF